MRSLLGKSTLLAGVLLVLGGGTAAQASVSNVMEVRVPFPFVVGRETFPAGQYMVARNDIGSSVLMIRGENNHAFAFMATMPADGHDPAGDKPALTFTRHENQYRLSRIWQSGTEGESVIGR